MEKKRNFLKTGLHSKRNLLKWDSATFISDGKFSVTTPLAATGCLLSGHQTCWKERNASHGEQNLAALSEMHFVAFLPLTRALACHRSQHAFPSFLLSNVFDITGIWRILKPRKDIQWGRSPPTMVQNTGARIRSGVYAAEPWVLWSVGEGDCLQVTGNTN